MLNNKKYKKTKLSKMILVLLFVSLLYLPSLSAQATTKGAGIMGGLNNVAQNAYDTTRPGTSASVLGTTGLIINILLGLIGVLFLILMIVAGLQWMGSGGNAETIKKARERIINAIIGLVIVLAAYVLTNFVFTNLFT